MKIEVRLRFTLQTARDSVDVEPYRFSTFKEFKKNKFAGQEKREGVTVKE